MITTNYTAGLTFQGYDSQNVATSIVDNISYYGISGYTGTEENVLIPSSYNGLPVKQIDSNSFNGNTTITSVNISFGTQTIGQSAFQSCTNLNYVSMDDSVLTISTSAFQSCTSLSTIVLSNRLQTIQAYAFANTAITTLNLPVSLQTLESYSLSSMKLTSIILPNGITSLLANVFANDYNLRTVVLPSQLTAISVDTFNTTLKFVWCLANIPPAFQDIQNSGNIILYVPFGNIETMYIPLNSNYSSANIWNVYSSQMKSYDTSIFSPTKMQDLNTLETALYSQNKTLWQTPNITDINDFISSLGTASNKILNATQWNYLINKVNDATNTTSATSSSMYGMWLDAYNSLVNRASSFTFAGEWTEGTNYAKNNMVRYNNTAYYCLQDHTSSSTNVPPNATYWIVSQEPSPAKQIVVSSTAPSNLSINDIYIQSD